MHTLTTAYASVPGQIHALDVLQNITVVSAIDFSAQAKQRNEQVTQIDSLHLVLIDYMQSLGALANNNLVQTSTDAQSVTTGLTALSKAKPDLGLTTGMISGVGDICTFLGDAVTAGYREEQLTTIIGKSEPAFQQLVAAEKQIVTEGVIKDLTNVEDRVKALAEVTHALQVNAKAEAMKSKLPQQSSTGVAGLDPKLQRSGAADIASLYLLQQAITNNLATLDLQIKAANAYVTALDKIASAHSVLYANRDNLLSKAGAKTAIAQLTPLIKEANTALQALKSV
ncbi:hypothetical protein GNZ12_38970 [Paraburkholderia sp. 1N]|uniref:Uncharacterized protein n=1 Tax=Paraburkholderia solitsugae TaxID=2675748 RepID=A0ABX2C2K8_9BURK|nr:hypothetical protein [Paraburkholderia solitsugae]NPT47174.1 hypothetical protein [Paraburkholderia solitsugae]